MLRKLLLPGLAVAALAGCATGYSYRAGNGDYYYGQPQVEYRYYDSFGPYGSFYGNGIYGRFGYGFGYSPYGYGHGYRGGYWNSPYSRWPYWYRPRPPHGHPGGHDHGDHDNDHDGDDHRPPPGNGASNGQGRVPPWRDFEGRMPRDPGTDRGEPGQRPWTRPLPHRDGTAGPMRESQPIRRQTSPRTQAPPRSSQTPPRRIVIPNAAPRSTGRPAMRNERAKPHRQSRSSDED